MPLFLLLVDGAADDDAATDARVRAWIARGTSAGVVRGGGTLSPGPLRVLRGAGVTVTVRGGERAGPRRAVLFEAEDEPSALAWAAACPGEGALGLYGVDDEAGGDWVVLRE
ncbi:MAG: hypothetical protein ACK4N5_12945 [Myxococcales bacterium]